MLYLFSGCNKSGINEFVDFESAIIDSVKTFIPKKIKYSKVGLLTDTIRVNLIAARDDCRFLSFGKTSSYFIVCKDRDTFRIISPCAIPKINDSLDYSILELFDLTTFIPTKPMLYNYEFPSYGNHVERIDTAKIITIFGKPIYNVRKIPKTLMDCMYELDTIMSEEMKTEIKADTISLHFGLGMWLRNNWGLWSGSDLQNYFKAEEVIDADGMSSIILHEYKVYLLGIKLNDSTLTEYLSRYDKILGKKSNNDPVKRREYVNNSFIPYDSADLTNINDMDSNEILIEIKCTPSFVTSFYITDSIATLKHKDRGTTPMERTISIQDNPIIDTIKNVIESIPSGTYKSNTIDGRFLTIQKGKKVITCLNCLELKNVNANKFAKLLDLLGEISD